MSEAIRQPRPDRIDGDEGEDRNCVSCLVCGQRGRSAYRNNGIYAALLHYFFRQRRERIDISCCVSELETNIAPFGVTKLVQVPANLVSL